MFLEEKKQGEAVTLEPWRQLLLETVSELEQRGWCQGSYENRQGQVCIFGGMLKVREAQRGAFRQDAWDRAYQAVHAVIGAISYWNDTEGRTKDEVISTLRGIALHGRG